MGTESLTAWDYLLWVAFPYAASGVFVAGHLLRYRDDQFGWTSRSSQTYENQLLRWGSPMFHYGMLMVIGGHVVGRSSRNRGSSSSG
jgi:nitrate reductase gamma subunit